MVSAAYRSLSRQTSRRKKNLPEKPEARERERKKQRETDGRTDRGISTEREYELLEKGSGTHIDILEPPYYGDPFSQRNPTGFQEMCRSEAASKACLDGRLNKVSTDPRLDRE